MEIVCLMCGDILTRVSLELITTILFKKFIYEKRSNESSKVFVYYCI